MLLEILTTKKQSGQTAIITAIFVLVIALFIALAIGHLILNQQQTRRNLVKSAQAYYAAESGVEDSLYRIIKGKNYSATNSIVIASSTVSLNITNENGQEIITASGESDNRVRNLRVTLNVTTDSVSFYYGVQVGAGGLDMSNNSKVTGSIYSNGSVQGGNGALITGDAWVASQAGTINQQSIAVNADFVFGQASPVIDVAQSFTPSVTGALNKISIYLKKTGLPGDKTVRILTDNGNKPSKNLVSPGAYGTLATSQVSQNDYGWVDVTPNTPPTLQANVKYWIVIDSSANSSNYLWWAKDSADSYSYGMGMYSPNWNASSPSWSSAGGDLAFQTWMGGTNNYLQNITVGANAHANTIDGCTISGDAYYQTITNSSVAGQQYPGSSDPAIENMPISENNISDWKAVAETGGVLSGDYNLVNGATASLGPKKINGNLNVSNNADLTITGTVYVTGSINISNGAKIRLGANYGNLSGVVLSDSPVSVSNNSIFYTNGAGTYLMILTTATGTAISVANNANTVIFYASRGTVNISNNAILKEVTAYAISLSNGAQVNYESGLASAKFSSGTGAGWAITDWRETQ